mmetsp:Transcript_24695/g.37448  ORF Transcript_24695/g.37448 Transcript_24695/m.37448 type:complete len:117 (+) Transcript_24695:59-409(+)|eukprot:scaffold2485_cov143-Skeletonema_dohrnii-CCMP3373.AAC.2
MTSEGMSKMMRSRSRHEAREGQDNNCRNGEEIGDEECKCKQLDLQDSAISWWYVGMRSMIDETSSASRWNTPHETQMLLKNEKGLKYSSIRYPIAIVPQSLAPTTPSSRDEMHDSE